MTQTNIFKPAATGIRNGGFRPYQIEDYESIKQNYFLGVSRQLIVQATGLGKTRMMAGVIHLMKELEMTGKVFVLVHRQELATQTRDEFLEINPELRIAIEQGSRRIKGEYDVLIGSVQTLGTARKDENGDWIYGKRIKMINPDDFDVVLVDETHRASSATFRSVIQYMGVYQKTSIGESSYEELQPE